MLENEDAESVALTKVSKGNYILNSFPLQTCKPRVCQSRRPAILDRLTLWALSRSCAVKENLLLSTNFLASVGLSIVE